MFGALATIRPSLTPQLTTHFLLLQDLRLAGADHEPERYLQGVRWPDGNAQPFTGYEPKVISGYSDGREGRHGGDPQYGNGLSVEISRGSSASSSSSSSSSSPNPQQKQMPFSPASPPL